MDTPATVSRPWPAVGAIPSPPMRELAIAALALCGCARGGSGTQADGGTGGVDGAVPDGMPVAMTWRDDSAADFTMGSFDGTAVESYGALVPAAYYAGGLLW